MLIFTATKEIYRKLTIICDTKEVQTNLIEGINHFHHDTPVILLYLKLLGDRGKENAKFRSINEN